MRDILQQVLNIPGAVGALTYNTEGTILAAHFPDQYEASALQRMARLLSEDFLVQQAMEGESGGLDLRYFGGRIILRPFSRGAVLALCAATANVQLVNLALIQAVHRLEKVLPEPGSVAAPKAPPKAPPAAADLVHSGVLGALKQTFLGRIGPIGELLFTQIHSKWSSESGRDDKRLREFITLLAKELDDPDDEKAFIRDTRNIIG